MISLLILQLRNSLAIIEELQVHEQNPDKYDIYEKNKMKLLQQIKELDTRAHNPQPGSRMPSAPRSGGASAVLEPVLGP
jgi:hypothetical protein